MHTPRSINTAFGGVGSNPEIRSSRIFTKKCPLVSPPVLWCPLVSHSSVTSDRVRKNPCYNCAMKRTCHSLVAQSRRVGAAPPDSKVKLLYIMRLFETETGSCTPIFFGNRATFLRPVSFSLPARCHRAAQKMSPLWHCFVTIFGHANSLPASSEALAVSGKW